MERQSLPVDIACVGLGPATNGFLYTLLQSAASLESRVMPGMPLQVMAYERADDYSFGVSGVVTRARSIKKSLAPEQLMSIPMATKVTGEKLVYLQDPIGASVRPGSLKFFEKMIAGMKWSKSYQEHAYELPYIPPFLEKHDGMIFSIGQFNSWVSSQIMGSGLMQLWPASPVSEALIENDQVLGIRLMDQGTDRLGNPSDAYMPGMDIQAQLTVVGDGPVGAIGQQLDRHFGMPKGHKKTEWAVGMKMVVELPQDCPLKEGTVLHTLGFPEPEMFGFLYVHPDNVATLGLFVPSFLISPIRTAYRYLQHWMQHPYLWRYLKGGTMRSWGAKSILEAGKEGEPYLVGNGYARIGESSGSTNILSGSGVDEAWATGTQLAEGVVELYKEGLDFTKENLEKTYVKKRRSSWVEKEAKIANDSRNGFAYDFTLGLMGMGITGLSKGAIRLPRSKKGPFDSFQNYRNIYKKRLSEEKFKKLKEEARKSGKAVHDLIMNELGWPEISYDGKLLMTQQDALFVGGKVQAPPSQADHVVFLDKGICEKCEHALCVEICSGQAITMGEDETPQFDREKCVHCGACLWNCTMPREEGSQLGNIDFRAGGGGLHSAEN